MHPEVDFSLGEEILRERLRERQDDPVNRMLYTDVKESLPGDMLKKVDHMSMLSSLEVRVPFLDHRVCELAFSISGGRKLRNGKGKFILVETFKDLLPPIAAQPAQVGLRDAALRLAARRPGRPDRRLPRAGADPPPGDLRCRPRSRGSWRPSGSAAPIRSWQLWNLIVFQVWHEKYMAGNR